MRNQMVFRIQPELKRKIAHTSIEQNINMSDLVNNIIQDTDLNNLNLEELSNQPKLSKKNVQVAYQIEDINRKKFLNIINNDQFNITNSQLMNSLLEYYFKK
ncbi:hypothetical protein [Staphylococcus durrellii]|uniref:hypothetical protein n=1 Tax=Staphylococcus durrellii TaxID=2781773 RepID=UPI00189DAC8B|nr:hypothetical protein [Staphylococcus durrellii]MBF7018274.1 hypothetical protein [Staphylococcus durrellii]